MTVCQYFLQGRCRFGQNCRYEHSYNSDDKNNRVTIPPTHQLSDVIKQIVNEIVLAEKGGQWPLSCFSPFKEGANFPGWEDISPEEVRWKMYEARAKGTLNECINEINQLYANAEKMRNLIKQPTNERINLIVEVLKGKKEQSTSNPFSSPSGLNKSKFPFESPSTNIFGGLGQSTTNQGSIFGGTPQSFGSHGAIFGGSKPLTGQGTIFGGTATQSLNAAGNIFGGNSTNFTNQNIFGGSSSPNTTVSTSFFSNVQSTNQNVFTNSVSSGNIFSPSPASNSNAYSGSQNLDQGNIKNNVNAFSSNASNTNNSGGIFSHSTSSSLFTPNNTFLQNNEPKAQNIFGETQTTNIFQNQNSFSGGNDTYNSQNIFKSSTQSFNNSLNDNQLNSTDLSVYSKTEELSEEELKAFAAATFSFGKIPLKPPPQSYCK